MKAMVWLCFILAVGAAQAADQSATGPTFGDWTSGTTSDGTRYVAVTNASGEIFGERCYDTTHKCEWVLVVQNMCTTGGTTGLLGATQAGYSGTFTATCRGPSATNGQYIIAFNNWQDLENLIKDGGQVGFVVSTGGTSFTVYRFSLNGAETANNYISGAALGQGHPAAPSSPATSDTHDTTL